MEHFRDGRNPGDALLLIPLLESGDARVRSRAAREISRLAEPTALPALFDAMLDGRLERGEFLSALGRFKAPLAWPVVEGQLDRLDPPLRQEVQAASAMLHENWRHWQVPPRLHSLVAAHAEALDPLTVAIHRWEAP